MSVKKTPLTRRKALLLAEGALLRAEAVHEVHQVKAGWSVMAGWISSALQFVSNPIVRRMLERRR